ncbi:hypothetical protein [Azotobacter salinestris]|uniref:hypothetical protein n=1 Tax=Azotobacter salinestris TaxID=69964 RepID=UPI0032DE73AF
MYDAINTLPSKEADRQRLARLMEKHAKDGNQVTTLPSYEQKPIPSRRNWIDPETKLKRRRDTKRELAALARRMLDEGAV